MKLFLLIAALALPAGGAYAQPAENELSVEKGRVLAEIEAQASYASPGRDMKGFSAAGRSAALLRILEEGISGRLPGDGGRRRLIDAVWALGELGGPGVEPALHRALNSADSTTRLNIAAALAKIYARSGAGGRKAAAGPDLAAAAAHLEPGDILFRKGYFGLLNPVVGAQTVGHVGIYAGVENGEPLVIEGWVPVRKAPLEKFIGGWPFYGNYTTAPEPDARQRGLVLKFAQAQLGKVYDYVHTAQKGPLSFDCVGLAEAAYEYAGLNPTPDGFETGWGWPLTPTEQYEHTVPNFR